MMLAASTASAQPRPASQSEGDSGGYEVALFGELSAPRGAPMSLAGRVYRVDGFASLRPSRAQLTARIEEYDRNQRAFNLLSQVPVQVGSDGSFTFEINMPTRVVQRPRLVLRIQGQRGEREFPFNVRVRPSIAVHVHHDRVRYEPGETAHFLARVTEQASGRPQAGAEVRIAVSRGSEEILDRVLRTGASGGVTTDLELPESAVDGSYRVQVTSGEQTQESTFTVGRRTVDRLLLETELSRQVVRPSGRLSLRVTVRTPSGVPVAGANVQVSQNDANFSGQTNAEGVAEIGLTAPAYIGAPVAETAVQVMVRHPAHGSLATATRYTVARSQWRAELIPEGGRLVPETDSYALLTLRDPRGEPAPEGTEIEVRGALLSRPARVQIDEHGLARLPLRARDGQAGPMNRGGCSGHAISLEIEVMSERPEIANLCVPVAPNARVRVRASEVAVAPGEELSFEVARHPSVRGNRVLVQLVVGGRSIASTFVAGDRGSLTIPRSARGVARLRARPINAVAPEPSWTNPGLSVSGVGSEDVILVRSRDAFQLELHSAQERYQVGDRARIELRRDEPGIPPDHAYAVLVARDLAAHGGERPWEIAWSNEITEAIARPEGSRALLLKAALLGRATQDSLPATAAPLVRPYWNPNGHRSGSQRGVLRDPMALRSAAVRQRAAQLMVQIEQRVGSVLGNPEAERGLLVRRGGRIDFDPALFDTLRSGRRNVQFDTLGGSPATLAMLQAIDPSFTFNNVARRIARARLVQRMGDLVQLGDPNREDAARLIASERPEVWLEVLVREGIRSAPEMLDPWGNAYVLRRSSNPRFAFGPELAGYELLSAGPDGRAGTGDDIRDPFARILPEDSLYAIASGENRLMLALSTLAPGPQALQEMREAFEIISLAARDAAERAVVSVLASEGFDGDAMAEPEEMAMDDDMGASYGMGGLGMTGSGRGGGGGYGRGAGSMSRRTRAAPAPMANAASFGQLGNLLREDFPATLFFSPILELDGRVTPVDFELADALTTYRVEAVVWTDRGWMTGAKVEFAVDREASVDAPVPPFASVGDELSLPVRIANHGENSLRVRVQIGADEIEALGNLDEVVEVPPRSSVERTIPVHFQSEGEGHLIVRIVRDGSDETLDAVRRPVHVWENARTVVETRYEFVEGEASLGFEVPATASARGPGQLRVVSGGSIFGDLGSMGLYGALIAHVTGGTPSEESLARARATLAQARRRPSIQVAQALAIMWDAPEGQAAAEGALANLARLAPEGSTGDASRAAALSDALFALATIENTSGPYQDALEELRTRMQRLLADSAVLLPEEEVVGRLSAARTLLRVGDVGTGQELLRRALETRIELEDEAFIDSPSQAGQVAGRLHPSAIIASIYAELRQGRTALRYIRHLASLMGHPGWQPRALADAAFALRRMAPGESEVTLSYHGEGAEELTLESQDGAQVAALPPVSGAASRVDIRVSQAGGAPGYALVAVVRRYGLPWTEPPSRPAQVRLEWIGEAGARDTRAGLALVVHNQSPRAFVSPELTVDLPSGTELDEEARAALRLAIDGEPTIEGRTLKMRLRTLMPGARVMIPMRLRWSVGGQPIGLGVVVSDRIGTAGGGTSILEPQRLELPDEGPEPEPAELEQDLPVDAPPDAPPPIPLDRLSPVAVRTIEILEVLA